MKSFGWALGCSCFLSVSLWANELTLWNKSELALKNKSIVEEVVALYQAESQARFGQPIRLTFERAALLQAAGGHMPNGPVVIVYPGLLDQMTADEVLFVTCHELGHILGYVNFAWVGANTRFNPLDAVEGEADFAGGACAYAFWLNRSSAHIDRPSLKEEARARAEQSVRGALNRIYNTTLNEQDVTDYNAGEIHPSYPPANCRLLSALHGVRQLPRPKCWYNPYF